MRTFVTGWHQLDTAFVKCLPGRPDPRLIRYARHWESGLALPTSAARSMIQSLGSVLVAPASAARAVDFEGGIKRRIRDFEMLIALVWPAVAIIGVLAARSDAIVIAAFWRAS
jgi:hypothetical protein